MTLSNKVYTFLKWFTIIFLPAIATLYFALSNIWGFPYAEQVVGTISAIGTFLGILLGISTSNYNKKTQENIDAAGETKNLFLPEKK